MKRIFLRTDLAVPGSARKRASQAWEEASSPIVRFRTDDGACLGFIFHHLEYARFERDTLFRVVDRDDSDSWAEDGSLF